MADHIYKHIRLTGTSSESIEKAVENAVQRAAKTVRHMRWFEVVDNRGHIDGDKVTQWQVTINVGFTLE
jgi:flavin-binding protein dodecin